jgi:hypothetical protein
MRTREQEEREFFGRVSELGDDELRVIALLAERLLAGQRQYGRLSLAEDPRDWRKERDEEIADLLMYSAFETLRSRNE